MKLIRGLRGDKKPTMTPKDAAAIKTTLETVTAVPFNLKTAIEPGKEVAKNLTRFHFRELIVPEASKEPLNAKLMAIRRGELIRGRTEYPTMEDVNSDWDRSESDAKLKEPPKPKEKRVKQDELVPNEKSALETNIEK